LLIGVEILNLLFMAKFRKYETYRFSNSLMTET
jgi:hypothetical protein